MGKKRNIVRILRRYRDLKNHSDGKIVGECPKRLGGAKVY